MSKDLIIRSSTEEFIIFKLQEKEKGIQVRYENETLWMTQKAMAELFDTGIDNINVHLKNIYDSNELDKESYKFLALEINSPLVKSTVPIAFIAFIVALTANELKLSSAFNNTL